MMGKENKRSQRLMSGRWVLPGLLGLALTACHDAPRSNPLDPGGTPVVEVQVVQDTEATRATLTWTPYEGPASFSEYWVLRNIAKAIEADTLAIIGDVGQTSFVDTALASNVPYTYRVSVVNSSGFEFPSQESALVHGSIGPRIAFYSTQPGNMELMAINPDGTNKVNLTNHPAIDGPVSGGDKPGRPAWSPDGSKIAFVSWRDGNSEVYVMDAFGTNQINLTRHGAKDREPSWSPDGSKIAFVSDRDGKLDIYVMNADGTAPVRLLVPDDNEVANISPWWSPDGAQLVFVSWRDSEEEPGIYVMDADGGNQVLIREQGWNPMWSPDGEKIVFMDPVRRRVARMNPDGSSGRLFGFNNTSENSVASMGPDGQIVASQYVVASEGLLLFSRTGSYIEDVIYDVSFHSWPSWSPHVE